MEHWYRNDDSNPCKDCGVCCSHFRISFYQGELASLGGCVPDDLTVPVTPFLVAMKGTECGFGACTALKDGQCGIYECRPMPCREFPALMDDGALNPKCAELKQKYLKK